MRRLIAAAFLLALASTPALAQDFAQGYVLNKASTAVTIANTQTATTVYSTTIPAITWSNFTQQQYGATNLHLKVLGTISTNPSSGSVGTINLGCSYGGTTASIALANGLIMTQNLSSAPLFLDLWVRTSNTAAPIVHGLLSVPGASPTSTNAGLASPGPASTAATVTGTTSVTIPQTLACSWNWGSASATNTVTFSTGVLVVGD